MKQKIIYLVNAMYCILALALVAMSLVLHRWTDALMLFTLFLFIALADWYQYKAKKLIRELSRKKDLVSLYKYGRDHNARIIDRLTEEYVKAKTKKLLMYKCDNCPVKSDTCQKLVYDTHTECVEPVEHLDL